MALILHWVMRSRLKAADAGYTPERALEQLQRIQRHRVRLNGSEAVAGWRRSARTRARCFLPWESENRQRRRSRRCCSGIFENTIPREQALASATVELGRADCNTALSKAVVSIWHFAQDVAIVRFKDNTLLHVALLPKARNGPRPKMLALLGYRLLQSAGRYASVPQLYARAVQERSETFADCPQRPPDRCGSQRALSERSNNEHSFSSSASPRSFPGFQRNVVRRY